MRYVLTRIDNDLNASKIAKTVDILRAIKWVAAAWNEVTVDTIKNCFAKCGTIDQVAEDNDGKLNEEFADMVKELTSQIDSNLTAE